MFSQGSRDKVQRYLWLKLLWDELTKKEFAFFLSLPETLNSEIITSSLRAMLILPKKVVRQRLVKYEKFLGKSVSTREVYLGMRSSMSVEIYRISRKLEKVTKFSGYIKSPSGVGTKRQGTSSFLEALSLPEDQFVSESVIDWYSLLTVDVISLFSGEVVVHPEEDQ